MKHVPVLLRECLEGLAIRPDGIYVDGTLGRAGHSIEIAKRLTGGRLIAIDRDEAAIHEAGERLREYMDKVTLVHGNFSEIAEILDSLNIPEVDGMLFDLGVSSPQLDDAERGFSYMHDCALDMRMDKRDALTAHKIVNEWAESDIRKILYEYGEERYSLSIARAIVRRRAETPINTTFELNDIIRSAIPAAARREKQHPAKRSYQAIRIAVNDELGAVKRVLEQAPDKLKSGGRICVISFHSLEDRQVKNAFASREKGCTCPKDFPVCICGFMPTLKVITRKPIAPREDELDENPRARSARLRMAQRV